MRRALIVIAMLAVPGIAVAQDRSGDRADDRVGAAHSIDWSGLYFGAGAGYFSAGSSDNASGSLFTGYNFGLGPAIAGVEAGWTATDVAPAPGQRLNSVVDLRGRLGISFDGFHVYGTTGAAWAPAPSSWGQAGLAAGAGVEGALTEHTHWGLQYVRYSFRNFRNSGNTLEIDLISGRISYKF